MRILNFMAVALGLCILAGCGGGGGSSSPNVVSGVSRYAITDLAATVAPVMINNFGQVAFTITANDSYLTSRSFLYKAGNKIDIGFLDPSVNGASTEALGLNDAGQVIGVSVTENGGNEAFLYSNGKMTALGTLGGHTSVEINAINGSGQMIGRYSIPKPEGTERHLFIATNGQLKEFQGLAGAFNTNAVAINDNGQVIVTAFFTASYGYTRSFLYSGGSTQDIGTLGGPSAGATAINNKGQIVGGASIVGMPPYNRTHAFLYSNGKMTDIGTLPGGKVSSATAINNLGQIVGLSSTVAGDVAHPFLYDGTTMEDLTTLIAPNSGWTLTYVSGINDQGQIVGRGMLNGQEHAFLLTPQ
jgi:probable HAF family extracellular repeat protein